MLERIISVPKIHFGLAGLTFDLLLASFLILKTHKGQRFKQFTFLLFIITSATFLEILRRMMSLLPYSPTTLFLLNIFHSLVYITSTGMAFGFYLYMSRFVENHQRSIKILTIFNATIYIIYGVIMIVNIYTGLISWYIAPDMEWVAGPFYRTVGYGFPLLFILTTLVILFSSIKTLSRRIFFTLLLTIIISSLGIILQALANGNLMLSTFSGTIGIYLCYFAVENFDYDRLLSMNKELELAKARAQESSFAKSSFLANMSHEIRTPMNAVLGLDEMILNSDDLGKIKEYAENIQTSGRSLLSIINDILDFSRIESGKMDLIETDYHLTKMIDDMNLQFKLRAEKQGLEYKTDVDENILDELHGDDVRVRQIITNVLNNAIKYTKEGYVKIIIKGSSQGDVFTLHVTVEDSGIGIKEENIPYLFQSFERFDEFKNRRIEGTGLGLAIVKRFLDLMGGSVDVKSVYGQGSAFTVHIPQKISGLMTIADYRNIQQKASKHSINEGLSAPNAQVLIVDDNMMNLMVAKGLMERTHAKVTTCTSGMECLELMTKTRFDIIFLDHMMPDLDGVGTLKKAQILPGNQNRFTPIIALTANAMVGMREEYLKMGFTDYISKPIESKRLYELFYNTIPKDKIIKVEAGE
ncbi:MAG: response regulator [Treponema sp.]|nr:response regulator [Treponema sp.]